MATTAVAGAIGVFNVATKRHDVPVQLKPGDPAPDFELPGSDGRTYRLKELAGRPVVLAWFPKAFTGGLTPECKALGSGGAGLRGVDVSYFAATAGFAAGEPKGEESLRAREPLLSRTRQKLC